jgi:hypothetical protein
MLPGPYLSGIIRNACCVSSTGLDDIVPCILCMRWELCSVRDKALVQGAWR